MVHVELYDYRLQSRPRLLVSGNFNHICAGFCRSEERDRDAEVRVATALGTAVGLRARDAGLYRRIPRTIYSIRDSRTWRVDAKTARTKYHVRTRTNGSARTSEKGRSSRV
jgi:hypothetical protein